jgi:membrane-associated phospholipid phosphatase
MSFDVSITRSIFALAGRSVWLERFFIFGARYVIFALFAAVVVGIWMILDGQARIRGLLTLVGATFASWGVTLGLEYLINRQRPYDRFDYEPLVRNMIETPSFPSAHATMAFAIATVGFLVDERLGWAALGLAALIAFSRVGVGVHYVADVVAGMFVGITISWLIYRSMFV